jgi:putative transposase
MDNFTGTPTPRTAWPHAPIHKLADSGTYFVTCGTYNKEHYFGGSSRLGVLHRGLLLFAEKYGWHIEAWAVFSNHYHFVGHSPKDEDDAKSLGKIINHLHTETATWVNKLDCSTGRKVWHNYRETRLNFPESYFARLTYTHNNGVKHGLVADARLYPWCSAGWFERVASPAQVKTVLGFRVDRIKVYDDFDPCAEW